MPAPPSTSADTEATTPRSTGRPGIVDGLVVVGLVGLAVAVRRGGLPGDGLVFDDAWVVVGASKGGLDDIGAVGTNHPGFTAVLAAWARLVSRRTETFALMPFAAGVVGPALAYVAARATAVHRVVAAAGAALLVVAPAHVQYSGRVKPYVAETAVALALVPLLSWLAARTWSWTTAAAWVVGAVVVGTGSALLTVITGVAGVVLAVHARGDRRTRVVAVVVQGVAQGLLLARAQSSFASERVAREWETTYDGYLEVEGGPATILRQLVTHVRRLGQEVVDGGRPVGLAVAVVAVSGLVAACWHPRRRVAAHLLLGLLAVGFAGGWARQVPFGPSVANPAFPGGRASLWLLPALLLGLVWAVDAAATWARDRQPATGAAVVAASAALAGVVVLPGLDDAPPYPIPGARTAAELVESQRGEGTVVLVLPAGAMAHAAEPDVEVGIVADAASSQGFTPRLIDPHEHLLLGDVATAEGLRRVTAGAQRVVVHNGTPGFGDGSLVAVEAELQRLGFVLRRDEPAGAMVVRVWERR